MYINIKQLAKRYDVSPAMIWRWVSYDFFPKPHKLGPATARWHEDDIKEFEARSATRSRVAGKGGGIRSSMTSHFMH